jgi:TM2 domain-containing membrane protein YozV
MSTSDPTAPVPRHRADEPAAHPPTPEEETPVEEDETTSVEVAEEETPDAFGLPEPPERGSQYEFTGSPLPEPGEGPPGVGQPLAPEEPPVEVEPGGGVEQEETPPDAFGLPEPPDRGAQHEFDAPSAVPPPDPKTAASWPPAPPSGYPDPVRPPQPGTQPPPPYVGGQPAPTPFPSADPQAYASRAGQPGGPDFGRPQPSGYIPPSGGNFPPTSAYPAPYGYPAVDPYAKSRTVAGVLGILLGGLGVHRFYLGYVGIGVAQIAVTLVTFGIGWLWGFVEGILYLTQRSGYYSRDASGRPLRD